MRSLSALSACDVCILTAYWRTWYVNSSRCSLSSSSVPLLAAASAVTHCSVVFSCSASKQCMNANWDSCIRSTSRRYFLQKSATLWHIIVVVIVVVVVAASLSGNALVLVNVVALRRAQLVLGRVTVRGYTILVFNQSDPGLLSLAIPLWVSTMSTGGGLGGKFG